MADLTKMSKEELIELVETKESQRRYWVQRAAGKAPTEPEPELLTLQQLRVSQIRQIAREEALLDMAAWQLHITEYTAAIVDVYGALQRIDEAAALLNNSAGFLPAVKVILRGMDDYLDEKRNELTRRGLVINPDFEDGLFGEYCDWRKDFIQSVLTDNDYSKDLNTIMHNTGSMIQQLFDQLADVRIFGRPAALALQELQATWQARIDKLGQQPAYIEADAIRRNYRKRQRAGELDDRGEEVLHILDDKLQLEPGEAEQRRRKRLDDWRYNQLFRKKG